MDDQPIDLRILTGWATECPECPLASDRVRRINGPGGGCGIAAGMQQRENVRRRMEVFSLYGIFTK